MKLKLHFLLGQSVPEYTFYQVRGKQNGALIEYIMLCKVFWIRFMTPFR